MQKFFFSFLLLLSGASVAQDEYSGQGQVSLEFRQFEKDQSELTEDTNISIFSRI